MRNGKLSLLLLVIALVVVSACGDDDAPTPTQAPTSAPAETSAPVETTSAPVETSAPAETAAPEAGLSGEITVAVHPDWEFFKEAADRYMAANPGTTITLEAITGGSDYFPTLPRVLATDEAPDITVLQVAQTWDDLVASGTLQDLSEVWTRNGLEDVLLPSVAEAYTEADGLHRAVNVGLNWNTVVYYNKDMFADLGIEFDGGRVASMAEFYEITDALEAAGKVPFAMAVSGYPGARWTLYMYATSNCGSDWMLDLQEGWRPGSTPQAKWTDPCAVEAINQLVEWNTRGIFGDSPATVTREIAETLVFSEEAGMFISGSWEVGPITRADLPFEMGWLLLPASDGAVEPNGFALAANDGLGVAANSDNPELAKDFLAYVTDTEFQTWMAVEARFSSRTDVAPDPSVVPELAVSQLAVLDSVSTAQTANIKQDAVLRNRLSDGWLEILVGTITPEELAADLERLSEELRAG